MVRIIGLAVAVVLQLSLAGCLSLIGAYDSTYDQGLNKWSEETAVFLAQARAGGPERRFASSEATAYYAGSYNLLDRLSERAALARGRVPCPANAGLKEAFSFETTSSPLPPDYTKFDCREAQLYFVRFYLDELADDHRSGGTLSSGETTNAGGQLQRAIQAAIRTFLVNKPS